MLHTTVQFHSVLCSTCRTYVNLYVQWSEQHSVVLVKSFSFSFSYSHS